MVYFLKFKTELSLFQKTRFKSTLLKIFFPFAFSLHFRIMNKNNNQKNNVPLCVDPDGTLIKTNILTEAFFALLRRNILFAFITPLWLLKGKSYFIHQITNRVDLDIHLLPYNRKFIDYLQEQYKEGRCMILITNLNDKYARQIAEYMGFFDRILTSNDHGKLEQLRNSFGVKGFDYTGNIHNNTEIWQHAREVIPVNPKSYARSTTHLTTKKVTSINQIFRTAYRDIKIYLHAIRIHQWLKNLLVFVPLITAHQLNNIPLLLQATIGFFSFSLCASSVYLLNDLLDLSVDRKHPRKRHRPFAAGTIPIKHGMLLIPALLMASFGIALLLPGKFFMILCTYYALTLAYSLWLKKKMLIDVLVLTALYTLRILAGSSTVLIISSFWLLAFSIFIFLSLAMVKRYSELIALRGSSQKSIKGRDYRISDLSTLKSLGISSGHMAVLVLALYINSEDIRVMYTHPTMIWLLCPLVLYWISRMWLIAGRGKMHDDPIIYAIKDRISKLIAFLAIVVLWMAI